MTDPGLKRQLRRPLQLLGWALGGVAIAVVLMVLPVLVGLGHSSLSLLLSYRTRRLLGFSIALGAGLWLQGVLGRGPRSRRLTRVDAACDWLLRRLLPWAAVLAMVAMLACWFPHYLLWPWWADTDHFAVLALSWRRGVLPYRDLIDYNFPGPTYLFWLLGVVFGWGKPWVFQAFDAAWLVVVLAALATWSRRRFATSLPGLTAGLFVASFYLELAVTDVGQRDWYTATLALSALLALQSSAAPGRRALFLAALAMALALATRPYACLFLPAVALASAGEEGTPRARIRRIGLWLALFAALAVLAFAPLMLFGIFDDFVRSLAYLRPGGVYNRNSPGEFWSRLVTINDPDGYRLFTGLGVALLAVFGPSRHRRAATAWLLALAGAWVYRPLSPVSHEYLRLPGFLFTLVALGFVLGVFLTIPGLRGATRLLGFATLLIGFAQPIPRNCSYSASIAALLRPSRVLDARRPPPGVEVMFESWDLPEDYPWSDYNRLLTHLRETTTPATRVANMLRRFPNPVLNGPVGRPTPFPHASGLLWFRWIGADREAEFARALETRADVVVWVPGEKQVMPGLELPALEAVVQRRFRPEARFGPMEVWRRLPD